MLGNEVVRRAAAELDRTPAQIALAWTLGVAPNVLLDPGHVVAGAPGAERGRRGDRTRRADSGATRYRLTMRVRDATADDASACVLIYTPYVRDTVITFETEVPHRRRTMARPDHRDAGIA